jgi:hypothetical protein
MSRAIGLQQLRAASKARLEKAWQAMPDRTGLDWA